MERSIRPWSRWSAAVAGSLLVVACSPEPTRVIDLPDAQMAKSPPAPSLAVSSTTPAFADRGQRLLVHVIGSGFDRTSVASWERGGASDGHINVRSTQFVSSTEVIADVEIAPDADVALYDVAVTITLLDGGRKKGVGIEKFEVTSAMLLPELSGPGNNSLAWDLNDAGQVVGRSNTNAFYWDATNGIDNLGPGQAHDISATGTIIVGTNSTGTPRAPMVWTGSAHNWTAATMSTSCVTNFEFGAARSIAPDGSLVGGTLNVTLPKNKSKSYPVVWDTPTSNCRVLAMPPGYTSGSVTEVSGVGTVLGGLDDGVANRATVWDAAGVPTLLAPVPGDTWSGGQAISPNGMIAAGLSGDRATYWVRTETGWSVGIPLTPKCSGAGQTWARAINDAGVIVGNGCDGGRWWRVSGTAIVATGLMPGLGPNSHPTAEGITNNTAPGQPWAAGGGAGATYWRVP